MLDFDTCNEARLRRDPAFDGLFFIAVKTTAIYCRPVCPAKMPMTKNVAFYASAAAAEQAGYRPCLRCRPETAPFCPAWKGTKTTVERALKLIEQGELDRGTVNALAGKLGIGPRHLSRLFKRHFGASPAQIAGTLRIQRAKRLVNQSTLSMSEISVQSGFRSVRGFNAAFASLYGCAPSSMRKRAAKKPMIATLATRLPSSKEDALSMSFTRRGTDGDPIRQMP